MEIVLTVMRLIYKLSYKIVHILLFLYMYMTMVFLVWIRIKNIGITENIGLYSAIFTVVFAANAMTAAIAWKKQRTFAIIHGVFAEICLLYVIIMLVVKLFT